MSHHTPNDDFKSVLVLAEQEENKEIQAGMFRAIAHLSVKFNDGMISQLLEDDDETMTVKVGSN